MSVCSHSLVSFGFVEKAVRNMLSFDDEIRIGFACHSDDSHSVRWKRASLYQLVVRLNVTDGNDQCRKHQKGRIILSFGRLWSEAACTVVGYSLVQYTVAAATIGDCFDASGLILSYCQKCNLWDFEILCCISSESMKYSLWIVSTELDGSRLD